MAEELRRRQFVGVTGGAIGSAFLAGCTGGDGGGGDGGDGGSGTEFPQEDILVVIPYGAGGYDVYTRLVAPYLETYLPNDVTVQPENRPGAGGVTPTTTNATRTYSGIMSPSDTRMPSGRLRSGRSTSSET